MRDALEVGQLRFEVRLPHSPVVVVETEASRAVARALSENDPEFASSVSRLLTEKQASASIVISGTSREVSLTCGSELGGFVDVFVEEVREGVVSNSFDGAAVRRNRSLESDLRSLTKLVAHDIRGPIRNARGFVALAATEMDPEKARAHLRTADGALARLESLAEGLLWLADLSNRAPSFATLDAKEVMLDVLCEKRAGGTELETQIDGSACFDGDRELLRIAFGALFDNAIRFSRPGEVAFVRIAIDARSDGVELSFSDRGIGIAHEKRNELFDLLRTGHPKRIAGSGLGLSIVRRVMDLHRGSAVLESIPNAGTTVTLFFPRETTPVG